MPWVEPEEEMAAINDWFGRRGKELWIKPHGLGFHAVVMDAGSQSGQALVYYADSASWTPPAQPGGSTRWAR